MDVDVRRAVSPEPLMFSLSMDVHVDDGSAVVQW